MIEIGKSGIRRLLCVLVLIIAVGAGACICYAQDYSELEYSGKAYEAVNGNEPYFTDGEKSKAKKSYESYGKLDSRGRCTAASASIGIDIMPAGERGDISRIHPTGWQSGMGWERCHLIGWQLTGEDDNERNLITGTHYFNVTGMLPFENMVADYIYENRNNHVLYRVTPVFRGKENVARGALMEGWSVEDDGEGICFNVYVFNVNPDAVIDYSTGVVTVPASCEKLIEEAGAKVVRVVEAQRSYMLFSDEKGDESKSEQIVYWSPSGSVYHLRSDCSSFDNAKAVLSGTIEESGKSRLCARCAAGTY